MAQKKRYYDEQYAGMDMRRRREHEDSMMIKEDLNAVANLPQEVKYVEYPKSPYYKQPMLNDTVRGVDRQLADDAYSKSLKKNQNDGMY